MRADVHESFAAPEAESGSVAGVTPQATPAREPSQPFCLRKQSGQRALLTRRLIGA